YLTPIYDRTDGKSTYHFYRCTALADACRVYIANKDVQLLKKCIALYEEALKNTDLPSAKRPVFIDDLNLIRVQYELLVGECGPAQLVVIEEVEQSFRRSGSVSGFYAFSQSILEAKIAYYTAIGALSDAQFYCAQLLDGAEVLCDEKLIVNALKTEGMLFQKVGDLKRASDCFKKAADIYYAWQRTHAFQQYNFAHQHYIATLTNKRIRYFNEDNAQLKELNMIDSLTGVYNRRAFDATIDSMIAAPYTDNYVIGIVDIDQFKLFNDTYGHLRGDVVLRRVAELVRQQIEAVNGAFFRYGGEEFVFFVERVQYDEVKALIENCLKSVYNDQIAHAQNAFYPYVSISIGAHLCPLPTTRHLFESQIETADTALFLSKKIGRNNAHLMNDGTVCTIHIR
ncbi:MAG: GGDEF domain-containing protein, partial [Bacilli bacterium]